jgi:alanine racemase
MGRLGVRFDEVEQFATALKEFGHLRVDGFMTHFAVADELEKTAITNLQIRRFYDALETFKNAGFDPTHIDLANSPGAVVHPASRGNMVLSRAFFMDWAVTSCRAA